MPQPTTTTPVKLQSPLTGDEPIPQTITVTALQQAILARGQKGEVRVDDFNDSSEDDGLPPCLPSTVPSGSAKGQPIQYGFKTYRWLQSNAAEAPYWTPITNRTPGFEGIAANWDQAGIFGNAEGCWCFMPLEDYQKIRAAHRAKFKQQHTEALEGRTKDQVVGTFGADKGTVTRSISGELRKS